MEESEDFVVTSNLDGASCVVLICEHASNVIPPDYNDLGLSSEARKSHAAWDPGAIEVARGMSAFLDAPLIASGVSRLVYDCNRPPEAPSAMPAQSEVITVPGNADISVADRAQRAQNFYFPFRTCVADLLAHKTAPIIVTIHSFTPIYHGERRAVEIGILHDSDTRLADALLKTASGHTDMTVLRNAPYGPEDGVTHTLKEHAIPAGLPNVMLEIRNDLIATASQQEAVAAMIAHWLVDACALITGYEGVQCRA